MSHEALLARPRPPSARPARPLRVLVVDDHAESLEALADAIQRVGHRCLTATDGDEAWEVIRHQPVDAVLCDWAMPKMTGVELCRRVRARRGALYTYFILMTGMADRAHFLQGMRAGADDYLTKPVDYDELEVRLLTAARVIGMQRALAKRNATLRQQSDLSFKKARVDPLTDSGNRLRLREDLDALQARVARYGQRHSAALSDVDRFKEYNDQYGHLAGDTALRRVAGAMGATLRQGDTLYRYGGEEFLVILPGQELPEARIVMERVRRGVESLEIPHAGSDSGKLTISVGVAELGANGETCDDWLQRADSALYRAKSAGRNRVEMDGA